MLVLFSKSAVGNSWNCFKCPFPRLPCTTAIVTKSYWCSAWNDRTSLRVALNIHSASLPSEVIKVSWVAEDAGVNIWHSWPICICKRFVCDFNGISTRIHMTWKNMYVYCWVEMFSWSVAQISLQPCTSCRLLTWAQDL